MCQGLLLTGPPSRSGLYLWCLKLAACGLYILPPDFILYFANFCQGSMLMFRSAMKLFSWPLDACSSIVIFFIFILLFNPITSVHAKRWMLSYFFDRYYIYFYHLIMSFVWPQIPSRWPASPTGTRLRGIARDQGSSLQVRGGSDARMINRFAGGLFQYAYLCSSVYTHVPSKLFPRTHK